MTTQQTLKVQLIKSPIGTRESHRATVRGLGLRKINSVSELQDTPAVRGMINKISYLVKVISERPLCNSIASSRQPAPSTQSVVSAAVSVPVSARPQVAVTRVKNPVPVDTIRWASKAVRCQCSGVCQSVVSSRIC